MLLRAFRDLHNTNERIAAKEAGILYDIGLSGDARSFLESDGAVALAMACYQYEHLNL